MSSIEQNFPLHKSRAKRSQTVRCAALVESVMFAVFTDLPEVWMTENLLWCKSLRILEVHYTMNIKTHDGVDHPAIHQRTLNAHILFSHESPPQPLVTFELNLAESSNAVLSLP